MSSRDYVIVSAVVYLWIVSLMTVDGCPSGWTNYGDSCYHFSHDTEQWVDAQVICREFEGYLVEKASSPEQNFLSTETIRRGTLFWIGATDLFIEREWQWMTSHTAINRNDAFWAPGQPDNQNGNDNCAGIRNSDGKWYDERCSVSMHYICERSGSEAIVG
ncbi:C-type lectin domain family 4 member M-like [Dreissena polymorpha]|uniref:C-type lectin domain-containing protein n=1 Tax=Dreissena polymorpha TaxID=45954 RepID=A0A9D4NEH4_DREPO|nr:C-type lectin domain family 4 member M-like [Dreissena polymorpha]KAH3892841.1 hypothetical protein DPMN_016974 [Dreissena polymorpha]